jgi:ElaB/YqjD/DUF883 family membrane-anchored ribosome-binding protein
MAALTVAGCQGTAGRKGREESTSRNEFNQSPVSFHPMSEPATILPSALPADNILSASEELRAAAAAKARQLQDVLKSDDVKAAADRAVREAVNRWREVSDNAAAFVREHPGQAAVAALGIGFAIGLLFRRD